MTRDDSLESIEFLSDATPGVDRRTMPGGSSSGQNPKLALTLLGAFSASLGGRELRNISRKGRALLVYLALCEGSHETRERLAGLLWSESSEERARASLRQSVKELRECFADVDFAGFLAGNEGIGLVVGSFSTDVADMLAELRTGRTPVMLSRTSLASEQLGGDLDSVDPQFRSWLTGKRQWLHNIFLRALEGIMAAGREEKSRVLAAEALLNLDPTHEAACRELMRSRVAAGDVAGALRAYKILWDTLDQDFDIEPSQETMDLVVAIKQQPAGPPARTQTPAQRRKLAVLIGAFDWRGISSERRYLVAGFRHELLACLFRFREWWICDAASSTSADRAPPGAEQGYHLSASALEMGDNVRLILTLAEVSTGEVVWSDRLLISAGGWVEAQQNTVRRIAAALNVNVSQMVLARSVQRAIADASSYDDWLRGQYCLYDFAPASWRKAGELFRAIIARNPDFSPAYSSLAQQHNTFHLVHAGYWRSDALTAESIELAARAVELDPNDSRAQLANGWSSAMGGRFDAAARQFRIAHELNDSDPWTGMSVALGLAYCGDLAESRAAAELAAHNSLMPTRLHWGYLANIRFFQGDYDGCLDADLRSEGVIPNLGAWSAAALSHLGRKHEAEDRWRQFCDRIRRQWSVNVAGDKAAVSDAEIARWVLHLFPFRNAADWERFRHGVVLAGADAASLRYPLRPDGA